MSTEPLLSVRGVRKSFGDVEVLHGVDVEAKAGSVLALLGENGAGKSTLVRIIAGDYKPDEGVIALEGERVDIRDVAHARSLGIRLIYQEISDAPTLTVAENVSLGDWPTRGGFVNYRAMRDDASRLLSELGLVIDVDVPVSELRLGERQAVEIARALRGRGRVLIFDEPTAALSDAEADRLFTVIDSLRIRGVAIVYITHRLDEVFRIADEVCVLRDGEVALADEVSRLDRNQVIEAMVGHSLRQRTRPTAAARLRSEPALSLGSAASTGAFDDVNLDLHSGEVVALYGKVGSGATEVAEACFGMRQLSTGRLSVKGQQRRFRHPADAIVAGIGCLPGDRQREAIFKQLSLAKNLAAPSWSVLSRAGWIRRRSENEAYRSWHDELRIKSRNDPSQLIWQLSGGNQQKVVLGRWLEKGSEILVLVEPTRGVDVGARQEIYRSIRRLAETGSAVLVATSDYEDVVEVADRAAVMVRGRVVASLSPDQISVESLTDAAGGVAHV